jgi:hypothetical protein
MARAAEEAREFDNPNELTTQVREYAQLKATTSLLEERQKQLRGTLFEHLDTEGEIDDKGNIFLELPEPVDGIVRIEKQRRTSRKVDEVAAEEILVEDLEEIFDTVKVVNEDKLMAAFYEGKLDENDLERIFPATVTWALTTKKK